MGDFRSRGTNTLNLRQRQIHRLGRRPLDKEKIKHKEGGDVWKKKTKNLVTSTSCRVEGRGFGTNSSTRTEEMSDKMKTLIC